MLSWTTGIPSRTVSCHFWLQAFLPLRGKQAAERVKEKYDQSSFQSLLNYITSFYYVFSMFLLRVLVFVFPRPLLVSTGASTCTCRTSAVISSLSNFLVSSRCFCLWALSWTLWGLRLSWKAWRVVSIFSWTLLFVTSPSPLSPRLPSWGHKMSSSLVGFCSRHHLHLRFHSRLQSSAPLLVHLLYGLHLTDTVVSTSLFHSSFTDLVPDAGKCSPQGIQETSTRLHLQQFD